MTAWVSSYFLLLKLFGYCRLHPGVAGDEAGYLNWVPDIIHNEAGDAKVVQLSIWALARIRDRSLGR
jgi:hypothetical protein